MGIKNLAKLIKTNCPNGINPRQLKYYTGHKVAVDASLCIYQFLVSIRIDGANMAYGDSSTSHLNGLFYRSIRWIENGIIPVFVFDGAAPAAKVHELAKRNKRREEANAKLEEAKEKDDAKAIEKYARMNVKMEAVHIEECQKLLKVMRIPFLTAPSEAEAHCAWLCKNNYVDAVATEDMDTLSFGSPILLRNFNVSSAKKIPIDEYNLKNILKGLNLNMSQFRDLCILLGCDYSCTLKGIGVKRAFDLIKKHGSITGIFEDNPQLLEDNPEFKWESAKEIFTNLADDEMNAKSSNDQGSVKKPENIDTVDKENGSNATKNEFDKTDIENTNIDSLDAIRLRTKEIDIEEVAAFLCEEKGFERARIEKSIKRLMGVAKATKQTRIDQFFAKK